MSTPSPASFPAPKPHYAALDGLRGVAAVMVVLFHMFEGSARDLQFHTDQIINHGYLSVDFFFMLSGFVIGYAYDDRWGNMTLWNFCKRRLVRLQPMVVMGMLLGGILFYFQGSEIFPNLEQTPVWKMLLVMTVGFTLLPVPVSLDVRGWSEMHPLNGPAWSLFFEYVANILYAVLIRKFTSRWLAVLVFLAGCALIHQCYTQGNNIGGWTLDAEQCRVGLTRLMFPFFGGLLLFRLCKPGRLRHGFWWCSLLIVVVLSIPRIGGEDGYWMNGLYEAFCIICVFPVIVSMGAGGKVTGKRSTAVCKFLGDISYPIYITHYPLVYTYTAWVCNNNATMVEGIPYMILTFVGAVVLAYACLKLYDLPVRNWLKNRFLVNK